MKATRECVRIGAEKIMNNRTANVPHRTFSSAKFMRGDKLDKLFNDNGDCDFEIFQPLMAKAKAKQQKSDSLEQ